MCSRNQLNMLTSEIVHEYRKVYGESIDSILLLDAGQYKDSIGRSYYAIFFCSKSCSSRK